MALCRPYGHGRRRLQQTRTSGGGPMSVLVTWFWPVSIRLQIKDTREICKIQLTEHTRRRSVSRDQMVVFAKTECMI